MDWTILVVGLSSAGVLCGILGYVLGLRDASRIQRQALDKWLQ